MTEKAASGDKKAPKKDAPDYRIHEKHGFWWNAWKVPVVLAVIGGAISAMGFQGDPGRFGYAYLFAFATVATLVLGGLFLTIALNLTAGHWGITARRIAEIFGAGAPLLLVLFLPIAGGVMTGQFTMYDEWLHAHDHGAEHGDEEGEHADHEEHSSLLSPNVAHAQEHEGAGHAEEEHHAHTPQEEALHHAVLAHKAHWLAGGYWNIRSFFYLICWVLLGLWFFRMSRRQDQAKEKKEIYEITLSMKKWAPLSGILFGLTLTFAAFDWLMSLEPAWYSTIFGVTIFAGCAISILAMIIILGIGLQKANVTGNALNVEHFHDHGKLLFGFMCFWAYVCFSQWMLIWYAGIPEEATWYHKRWDHGWSAWALFLMIGHFGLPFYFLISRLVKRNLPLLRIGAVWLFGMHVADMYMQVIPQAGAFGQAVFLDVGALLLVGGIFFAYVLYMMKQVPLMPTMDPRFERCLHHHQSH